MNETQEQSYIHVLGHFATVLLSDPDESLLSQELATLQETIHAMERQHIPVAQDWRKLSDLGMKRRSLSASGWY